MRTTASQNFATVLGCHSLAEAMLIHSPAIGGLECSFHRCIECLCLFTCFRSAKLIIFFNPAKFFSLPGKKLFSLSLFRGLSAPLSGCQKADYGEDDGKQKQVAGRHAQQRIQSFAGAPTQLNPYCRVGVELDDAGYGHHPSGKRQAEEKHQHHGHQSADKIDPCHTLSTKQHHGGMLAH